MLLSDVGMSLHAEGCADSGAPLSLDSAIQERLQQERASLQSQMELLEKKKNEEIQNLKTSLIAEQQVCGLALLRKYFTHLFFKTVVWMRGKNKVTIRHPHTDC